MAAIELRGISKSFRLDESSTGALFDRIRTLVGRSRRPATLRALDGIDLSLPRGEKVGVIGKNGSGKTTLMRLIAGIYAPSSGTLRVEGRVASFLQLGIGMIKRLTVRENIFLYGALLGRTRRELASRLDRILEFAELGEFADVEVRRLSSGMIQRLGFAVALEVDADVLLLDEILAVGDQSFRNKCYETFEHSMDSDTTVLFSSHTLKEIERFCTRTVWLENGRLAMVGPTSIVLPAYKEVHGYPLEESARGDAKAPAPAPAAPPAATVRPSRAGTPADTPDSGA